MRLSFSAAQRTAVALAILACSIPSFAWADDLRQIQTNINIVWVVATAALVFFMQAGFLILETGLVRSKNMTIVALKNLGDWVVVSIAFYLVGFGLMFGHTLFGGVGLSFFAMQGVDSATGGHSDLGWAFVIFQLAFCGTAATIVSGAMAERTGFKGYIAFATIMGVFIYPVFCHWVWGGLFLGPENAGWLERLGYHDFAGSSVVHCIGGWASLVGVWCVGPRLGRYQSNGEIQRMDANGLAWAAFGTAILWFGWWGFNGGSTLAASSDVPRIIFNTNLSAVCAALVGFVHATWLQGSRNVEEKLLGCILGGLVAITASCDIVSPPGAILIGAVAGVIHNLAFELIIRRWRLDDVVGAVPVHAFCGTWGCLAVALVGRLPDGVGRWEALGVQALGVTVCFVWATSTSLLAFLALRRTVGLRIDPIFEIEGVVLSAELASNEDPNARAHEPDDLEDDEEVGFVMDDIRARVRAGDRLDVY